MNVSFLIVVAVIVVEFLGTCRSLRDADGNPNDKAKDEKEEEEDEDNKPMSRNERLRLRDEARDMFYHAYNAYMANAYPADELMPLSCAGRYRGGRTPSRGDIDDSLGNFSLTLIDSLDTLVILNDLTEFEEAVKLVLRDVHFDTDVVVSVFETNIRVLGGLLSAHVLADLIKQNTDDRMQWYDGELLRMATDVGLRLLPAFNTSTGIPLARINLRHGVQRKTTSHDRTASSETCTACGGTTILEMATLSRLTGVSSFERKSNRALTALWSLRNRRSDLMGTVLNVESGEWIRRDSGVGAGIDSYYEYLLKSYVLLGNDRHLTRFQRHYAAVTRYVTRGERRPLPVDVHMHRPMTAARAYVDALLAFWPGVQVMIGDIEAAVETHELLFQVVKRHDFIPEAFTADDFQVYWSNHPLRPEFIESNYFLYKATSDVHYLNVAKRVMSSLQKRARVPCGYAAMGDVRSFTREDRMDSFVLAETFKYLYLTFAEEENDLPTFLKLDEYVFTTEGHLLPLWLSNRRTRDGTFTKDVSSAEEDMNDEDDDIEESLGDDEELSKTAPPVCPNADDLRSVDEVRRPLRNLVTDGADKCQRRGHRRNAGKRQLTASEFSVTNVDHLRAIKEMGIDVVALADGRVQFLHTFAAARSTSDAEEGIRFMREMIELSRLQQQQQEKLAEDALPPQSVTFPSGAGLDRVTVRACPARFGLRLAGEHVLKAKTYIIHPFDACTDLTYRHRDGSTPTPLKGKIAIVRRGECAFVEKARRVEKDGAVGAIVIDNAPPTASGVGTPPVNAMFSMSGDDVDDVRIPIVFLFADDAVKLLAALATTPDLEVTIGELKTDGNGSPSTMMMDGSSEKKWREGKQKMDLFDGQVEELLGDDEEERSVFGFLKSGVRDFLKRFPLHVAKPELKITNEEQVEEGETTTIGNSLVADESKSKPVKKKQSKEHEDDVITKQTLLLLRELSNELHGSHQQMKADQTKIDDDLMFVVAAAGDGGKETGASVTPPAIINEPLPSVLSSEREHKADDDGASKRSDDADNRQSKRVEIVDGDDLIVSERSKRDEL